MIVDDSTLILEAIGSSLREAGYDVVTRSVPIGTGGAILREKPALVLMDVSMPLMTGAEISESLRASTVAHDSIIVLHSDRPAAELDALSRRCGAAGYIRKSAERRELLADVARFLAHRRHPTPAPQSRSRYGGLLVAAAPETLTWARRTLGPLVAVRCTDSGTEVLRLIGTGGAPRAVLLGTSLLDLPAVRAWDRAVRMDERWKQRIVVVDEPGTSVPEGPPGMMRWQTTEPLSALLEKLDIRPEGG